MSHNLQGSRDFRGFNIRSCRDDHTQACTKSHQWGKNISIPVGHHNADLLVKLNTPLLANLKTLQHSIFQDIFDFGKRTICVKTKVGVSGIALITINSI